MSLLLSVASVFEYGILLLLLGLSIWSISIMVDRKRTFAKETASGELDEIRRTLKSGDKAAALAWAKRNQGLHSGVVQTAIDSSVRGEGEAVDRSVRAYLLAERPKYEKGFAVLATLGANAPFIGLFGTVLGIVRAFAALGDNTDAASSVMSGISLALIATAAGLFVAIPAVVAFNTFSHKWKAMLAECDSLKELIVAQALTHSERKG